MASLFLRGRFAAALLVMFAFGFPSRSWAQQRRDNAPHPVDIIFNIFVDHMPNRAPQGLNIELQDGFGSSEGILRTDGNGTAQMQSMTGTHRLRIYGPDIQEYSSNFDVEQSESRHIENIVVRSKAGSAITTPTGPNSGMVAAARLKVPEKAQEEFKKGSKALTDKDWTSAKKFFDSAIAIYPEYDVAYNGLGSALAGSGNMADARPAFEKAISINPNFAEAERNLARISFAEKKYDEALTLLDKSLSADPLNAWALTSAANAALLTHHYDQAIAYARKAHSIPHPGSAGVHIVAALALEATQQPFEAMKEYQLYLDEDPKGRDAQRAQQAIQRLSGSKPT
jgi:tetratricopeptide (TPR) repeat protein